MYGRESADRLGLSPAGQAATPLPSVPKNQPSPMMLELQHQFDATKCLLQLMESLEQRLTPLLVAPAPTGTNEAKALDAETPAIQSAVHENTRAVDLAIARLRDILERLVI